VGRLGKDTYEAVVVGSGFGGAVAACRLAQAGVDVADTRCPDAACRISTWSPPTNRPNERTVLKARRAP
jgi:cation diffusion facilitator CzcD-associated flavoprotein CzcO